MTFGSRSKRPSQTCTETFDISFTFQDELIATAIKSSVCVPVDGWPFTEEVD